MEPDFRRNTLGADVVRVVDDLNLTGPDPL